MQKMKKITKPSLFVFIVFFVLHIYPTQQSPDIMIIKSQKYFLYGHPLDLLIEKDKNFETRFSDIKIKYWKGSSRSDNYRNYDAIYEINGDKLLIVDIVMNAILKEPEKILMKLFSNSESKVFCQWFTGNLPIVNEKELNNLSEDDIEYTVIAIESGIVIGTKKMNFSDYKEFRNRQLQEFLKSDRYQRYKDESMRNDPSMTEQKCEYLIREYGEQHYSITMMPEIIGCEEFQ